MTNREKALAILRERLKETNFIEDIIDDLLDTHSDLWSYDEEFEELSELLNKEAFNIIREKLTKK